jgi:phosphatidylglycerol:prolipoprotein diacylglycerol transferase
MPLAIPYPDWIRPEIIPGFPFLRWYGLMYLVAFATAFLLFRKQARLGELARAEGRSTGPTEDEMISFFTWGIAGLLLGARVFSTLVYEPTGMYISRPWLIFWPFDSEMRWTGLEGMSYHGGFIGGLVGMVLWCRRYRRSFLAWCDAMAASLPLGYTFGRLGNFLNGELYGRVTTSPVGMIFPSAPRFDATLDWVKQVAREVGIVIREGAATVNLPRHPSQLYEALFEGVVLWAIIWFAFRKRKPFNGFLTGVYVVGYGLVRFVIEYFRQPDADLGYRIAAGDPAAPTYLNVSLLNISTGQILCALMIVGGLAFLAALAIRSRQLAGKAKDEAHG